jgi:hypothetical protein
MLADPALTIVHRGGEPSQETALLLARHPGTSV